MPFIRLPSLVRKIAGSGPQVPGLLLGTTVWSDEHFDSTDFTHDELSSKIFPDRSKPVLYFVPSELITAKQLYSHQLPLCTKEFNVIIFDVNLEPKTAATFDGSAPAVIEAALNQGSALDLQSFFTLMGESYYAVLEHWGLIARKGEKQTRIHLVSTSGCCMPALRVAGEYPEVIKSLFLISPLLHELDTEEVASDFSDCCEEWLTWRAEARRMLGADEAAGPAELKRWSHRLDLPFSVTDGLRQYMLHDHPFPPHLAADILSSWRDKWVLQPLGGAELIQTCSVLADRCGSALTDEQWSAVRCKVVVVGGTEGQPQAKEAAELMKRKLSSAASFQHIHIRGAPLMAQMTHPDQVNRGLLEHLFDMEKLDKAIIPQRLSEAQLLVQTELFTPEDTRSEHSDSSHSDSEEDWESAEEELIKTIRPQRSLIFATLSTLAIQVDETLIEEEHSTSP